MARLAPPEPREFRYMTVDPRDLERVCLVRERVRCGKPGCRCLNGAKHGPYWYLRYEEWDRTARRDWYRREYVPPTELRRVRRWVRRQQAGAAYSRAVLACMRQLAKRELRGAPMLSRPAIETTGH
jgi:hypothetical protein